MPKYKTRKQIERTNARNRFYYARKKYLQERNKIRSDFQITGGGMVEHPMTIEAIKPRNLTTQQLSGYAEKMNLQRSQRYRDIVTRQEYEAYLDEMREREPNRYMSFIQEYGEKPSIEVIRDIFQSDSFRPVNGFVSELIEGSMADNFVQS